MRVNFNTEKLNQLLLDFYRLTGLTVRVLDADFRQLCVQPEFTPDFCRLIKSTDIGQRKCFQCDKTLCIKSRKTDSFVSHCCHAGLIDIAIPIFYKDTVSGYFMFGQALDRPLSDEQITHITELANELQIHADILIQAYQKLDTYEPEMLHAAARILKSVIEYLWLSNHIEIVTNDLATEINTYISMHYKEKISITLLCRQFGISKNKLYSLFHKQFHATVADYVSTIRMQKASKLLTSTEMAISDISIAVGIDDYNYFTKLFKKHMGITPLRYRKLYPLN